MWLRLLTGLGHCAWEPPHVMSRLRLWLPRLFLTWLQLWLQVQAVQPPEWALGPVQVTPNPPRLTEAWSSYASDPPPKLPHALTPLAEAGGFNYLTSSSPVQMLAPRHQELTETEAPYPDTGSVAELPTGPHQFAVPHQDLNNKQTQHQKIPEAVPVPDWDQNQPLVLPSRHKSKTENIGLDQAEGHQSVEIPVPPLGSKSSKPMKFIVSPPNLKKDLLQRQRLAKASTGQFEKHPQGLEQQLQGDYLDPSMDAFHPEESLSRAFLGGPDEPPEPPEEAELSPSQKEAQICHPELTEEAESLRQQEAPAQHPQTPEEVESFLPQVEKQPQQPEPTEEVEPPPLQQEAPSQPPKAPEELETSSPQEALAQLLETHQEVVVRLVAHHEVNEAQQSNVCNVTVKPLDLTLTITPQVTKEVEPSPVQQDTPSQPPESPEEVEPSPVQQETTGQPPEPLVEAEPSPSEKEQPTQPSEPTEPPATQQETPAQLSESFGEAEASATQEEAIAQPREPLGEFESSPTQSPGLSNVTVVFSPEHPVTTVSPLGQDQAQLLQRPDVTVKPVGLTLIITPAFTNEAETSPPQQETSAQSTVSSEQLEPLLVWQEFSDEHPIPSENVEFFPVHRGPPIQPPYPEVTFLNPEQVQAHHPTLIEVTIQPLDLGLTRRPEPTKEDEPSPVMQETLTQPAEPPKEDFVAQPPVYHNRIVPTPDQDHTEPPTSPSITVKPLNLELTTTPEPTTESEHSTARQQTTAPPPKHPEVTLEQPNLSQVTVPPVDLGVNISQQPRPSETVLFPSSQNSVSTGLPGIKYTPEKKQPEQNATTNISICELCTCKNETLSCVGLSPKQKLHRVPEPEPNAYNGTFTILNFQGNSISYIDESIWKAYCWAEKLNLSENYLTELHKDSFEGLLSLRYLDLSCNKIQSIERRTFEPLPFLQFINLGCNSLTELSFGTFQAWHGMRFLHTLILNRNPLTTVEDSHLFKLPALKYLDMGTTQVSLTTIESILMMTLELEKLILPSRMACCLCQFKDTIEVVCKTLKLRCDSECLTDMTRCDEETSIGNAEGSLMKVLQARKKNTTPELTIESERASSENSAVSLSGFMNEQLDFNNKSDIISALNYILPYIPKGNLGDVESALLPFIQLLFSNNSLAKIESTEERLLRANRVLKGPRGIQKMHLKAVGDESVRGKQNAQPSEANTAEERSLRRPSPRKLKQLLMVQSPRKLVGKSSNAESAFLKEHKAAGSSSLKQSFKGRPSASIPPKSPSEVKSRSKDLANTIHVLEDAKASVRNIKDFELISHTGKKYIFHKIRSHRVHRKPKGKRSRKFRKKSSLNRIMLASPPFSVLRSLINSPPREALSSSGEVTSQEKELFSLSDPSTENTTSGNNTAHNVSEQIISPGSSTLPGGTGPGNTTHRNVSPAPSTVAADNSMPTVQHTNQTRWEDHNTGTELSSKPTGFAFPGLTSPGDQVETQLNQQLRSLIPNNDVRRLISHVIQALKMNCSETHVQLACANLVSRTGLLLKLLSKQQEANVSEAEWYTDRWKADSYISESTEAQSEQKGQESSELPKEVPGYGYNNKLILAISVSVVVTIWVTILCLIEVRTIINSDSEPGFFRFLLCKRSSGESESQVNLRRIKNCGQRKQGRCRINISLSVF
ncbi:leucine-rich repeat-containing protein 37A2-like [Phocoena sinus]|uniref:leucine-rich repeat-containing protein 37A2-like n=1 Tax=Phocoena sinus TaxID=42100 RepID=UPI0013C49942|nr:leucine-rich repeat-containing protein 37A2-like [Phocoena sinus]